jgi:hypothetical protein
MRPIASITGLLISGLMITGLLIALPAPSSAQEVSPVEVFGGYSYFRPGGGGICTAGMPRSP